MLKIAAEYNCQDHATEVLSRLMNGYNWEKDRDTLSAIRVILSPIAAEISKQV
jgi:hypothetical protein